jgi:hypothetical protein
MAKKLSLEAAAGIAEVQLPVEVAWCSSRVLCWRIALVARNKQLTL